MVVYLYNKNLNTNNFKKKELSKSCGSKPTGYDIPNFLNSLIVIHLIFMLLVNILCHVCYI